MPSVQISSHFSLQELIHSDVANEHHIDNSPSTEVVIQLTYLCDHTLEQIRFLCGGHPVRINSGFRCPALNSAVGGVSDSAHLFGAAADIVIPDFGDVDKICNLLKGQLTELEIDQLINESDSRGDRWVHVGRAVPPNKPRHQSFSV